MEILVLDYLFKQNKSKQITPTVFNKVMHEIEQLKKIEEESGRNSLFEYLKNQNAKKMKGSEYIFKYRLTDGDRILYTYGKNLDYVREEDKDALVIVAYAKHDDQGKIKLPSKKTYYFGKEAITAFSDLEVTEQDLADMNLDNLDIFEGILSAEFTKFHTLYVVNAQEYADRDPNTFDVYLSEEQQNYIDDYMRKKQPLLVLGGAGTGKTVMVTHILADYKMQNPDKHCAYFTQSRELLASIKKKYQYISHTNFARQGKDDVDEDTLFFNINDYCRKKLGLLERDFVQTDQFLEFIQNNTYIKKQLDEEKIEPMDLWAEIRGTIKGGLDENWRRVKHKDRQEYKNNIIDELDKCGLLKWENNKRFFSNIENNQKVEELSKDAKEIYYDLKAYFESVDCSISLIEEDKYNKLSLELSTLSGDNKNIAYKLCGQYNDWLKSENKYDENDLIRFLLSQPEKLDLFDMVIVDEIQDYTELQIYFLHKLVRDDRYFIMAGDSHQNVNPTVFSERRINSLVGRREIEQNLRQNFRCKKPVVDCAKALSEMRDEYIARSKGARTETSERDGAPLMVLNYSPENEKRLIEALAGYPGTAILVPTESDKERLSQILHSCVNDAPDMVFTVAEIKGMEYRYVVCYNLIGCYKQLWEQILNEKIARKETRFRYYFNLFYVGITRSQDFLCFLEPDTCREFWDILENKQGTPFSKISEFDEIKLHVSDLSNSAESKLKQAKEYEKAGKFDLAMQWYKAAGAPAKSIKHCEMLFAKNKRQYVKSLGLAFEIDDKDTARDILPEIKEKRNLCKLTNVWLDMNAAQLKGELKGYSLSKTIDEFYNGEQADSIKRIFIEMIDNNFEKVMTNY